MKYTVKVKEISYGYVEVEADSDEEAEEKAEEVYFEGNVVWKSSDTSFEPQPLHT